MAEFKQRWINLTGPTVVVTERPASTLKGMKTRLLIEAIQRTAGHNKVLGIEIERLRRHQTKYAEAAALRDRYPDLAPSAGQAPVFRSRAP